MSLKSVDEGFLQLLSDAEIAYAGKNVVGRQKNRWSAAFCVWREKFWKKEGRYQLSESFYMSMEVLLDE